MKFKAFWSALAVLALVFTLVFAVKGDNSVPVTPAAYPTAPNEVCDGSALDGGPTSAPTGAITVPAGDNSSVNFQLANETYWFASGTHTLGTGQFDQIIPGNGATFIGGPGAVLDGQNVNKYAFTQSANGVTIQYLTIQNFEAPNNEGAVNHDSGTGWTIDHVTIQNNAGAGVMLGSENVVSNSCLRDNGQYGFSSYLPTLGALHDITLDGNEISGNNTDDWETQIEGCGCTGGGKFWDSHDVVVTNNYVHDNLSVGLWADGNNYDFVFDGNWIEGNDAEGIFFETGYNAKITNNVLKGNNIVGGKARQDTGNKFPVGAIYVSEAGYDSRVGATHGQTDLRIQGNLFEDNWGGVVLWENADRFCNSPANTTTGHCTLVNPNVTLTECVDGTIDTEPAYSDCRWKTQNVNVTENEFVYDPANLDDCTPGFCGQTGVLSNWGSFPAWSPYMGDVVQNDITFNQNNHFTNNTYEGPWVFVAKETGGYNLFAEWQASPFGQDSGSTYAGPAPTLPGEGGGGGDPEPTNDVDLGFELGPHEAWYGASVSHVIGGAHEGSGSLKFTTVDPWGSAIQLNNYPGYEATEDSYDFSLWYKESVATMPNVNWNIRWRDTNGDLIRTDVIPMPNATSWTEAADTFVAPTGTVAVDWTFTWSASSAGPAVQVDDVHVGLTP